MSRVADGTWTPGRDPRPVVDRITRLPFRAKFHLRAPEREYAAARGLPVLEEHARDFVARRLAPAHPQRDGKQTPWGGHPVFRAQHATATCCRRCLRINHGILEGTALTQDQQDYVVAVLMTWIERDLRGRPGR